MPQKTLYSAIVILNSVPKQYSKSFLIPYCKKFSLYTLSSPTLYSSLVLKNHNELF